MRGQDVLNNQEIAEAMVFVCDEYLNSGDEVEVIKHELEIEKMYAQRKAQNKSCYEGQSFLGNFRLKKENDKAVIIEQQEVRKMLDGIEQRHEQDKQSYYKEKKELTDVRPGCLLWGVVGAIILFFKGYVILGVIILISGFVLPRIWYKQNEKKHQDAEQKVAYEKQQIAEYRNTQAEKFKRFPNKYGFYEFTCKEIMPFEHCEIVVNQYKILSGERNYMFYDIDITSSKKAISVEELDFVLNLDGFITLKAKSFSDKENTDFVQNIVMAFDLPDNFDINRKNSIVLVIGDAVVYPYAK